MSPLWVDGLLVFAGLIACYELGFRLIARRAAKEGGAHPPDHLLSAVLGLLALLLGFTFSLSLQRHEERRQLVIQEADAIGTAWLRATLLEEPVRSRLLPLMRDYVDARIAWSEADAEGDRMEPTQALQARIWTEVGVAIRSDSAPQLSRALMDETNDMFDRSTDRVAARAAHLPPQVIGMLVLYMLLAAVLLGYTMRAHGRPHRVAAATLLLLLTLALQLILDLDRPRSGTLQVTQQPMTALRAQLR